MKNKIYDPWAGKHLTIDAYGIERSKLEHHKNIFDMLEGLPARLGMRKLTEPHLVFVDDKKSKSGDYGLSGFIMLYESHISCHTWPELGYVAMDIYSCQNFDEKKVLRYLKRYWGYAKMKSQVIKLSLIHI